MLLGANDRDQARHHLAAGDRGMPRTVRSRDRMPRVWSFVAFAPISTRKRLEGRQGGCARTPRLHLDHRYLLDDKSIDAVLIATPQHLHCEHFVAALDAGKHVYQEKTMAFNVDHAKRMRAAYKKAGKRTVQIGHQSGSFGQVTDATNFLATGYVGKVTAIHAHMYRNTPHGKPQWSRPVYPDMTSEHIIWKSFLGGSRQREFDPNRYARTGGFSGIIRAANVYENMCHRLSFLVRKVSESADPQRR